MTSPTTDTDEATVHLQEVCSLLIQKLEALSAGETVEPVTIELRELYLASVIRLECDRRLHTEGLKYLEQCFTTDHARQSTKKLLLKNRLLFLSLMKLQAVHIPEELSVSHITESSFDSDFWTTLGSAALRDLINRNELRQLLMLGIAGADKRHGKMKAAMLLMPLVGRYLECSPQEAADVSQKLCQALIYMPQGDGHSSSAKGKGVFAGKKQISTVAELDGTPCRDIFTVLNVCQSYHSQAMLSIYSFSVLRDWVSHLQTHDDIGDSLNLQVQRLITDSAASSPVSIGGSRLLDELSSGSDSTSAQSLSSSVSSLQSSIAGYGSRDRLDGAGLRTNTWANADPRARLALDSRPQTPYDSRPQTPHWGGHSRLESQISFDASLLQVPDVKGQSNLKTSSVTYCLRLISQSERTPRHKSDYEVIAASVIEALDILNNLCVQDSSLGQRVFPEIKRLYQRLEGQPLKARKVYVALLCFFIQHYREMMVNVEEVFFNYFKEIPLHQLTSNMAAFELFDLCTSHQHFFQNFSSILSQQFPNILKLFAWHPCTFLDETCDLMPLFVHGLSNATELLHCILDLPSLAALLELNQLQLLDDLTNTESRERLEKVLGTTIPFYFKAITNFILREQSGGAETIDKLKEFHKLLINMETYPRVHFVADTVCALLSAFFRAIEHLDDRNILRDLFPVLLERVHLLFPQKSSHPSAVQDVLGEELDWIVSIVPETLSQYQEEVLTCLSQLILSNSGRGSFTKTLIRCIGNSKTSEDSCNYEDVFKYYERIEMLIYEASQQILHGGAAGSDCLGDPEMMSCLMSSLGKLAAHNQELVPRAVVCLSKVASIAWADIKITIKLEEFDILVTRAQEILNILSRPKVAPAVLLGQSSVKPWHQDPNSSLLLKVHLLSNSL